MWQFKRAVSLLLTPCQVAPLLPVEAFAAGGSGFGPLMTDEGAGIQQPKAAEAGSPSNELAKGGF